jgi:hypothetical protein
LIDSGADCSVLPNWVASDLGVEAELAPTAPVEAVGGATIPALTLPRPIEAQVLLGGAELWGSPFQLCPLFADVESILLGRADFFRAFKISFDEHEEPPCFTLTER